MELKDVSPNLQPWQLMSTCLLTWRTGFHHVSNVMCTFVACTFTHCIPWCETCSLSIIIICLALGNNNLITSYQYAIPDADEILHRPVKVNINGNTASSFSHSGAILCNTCCSTLSAAVVSFCVLRVSGSNSAVASMV